MLSNIVEQEVGYYKYDLKSNEPDIYGENVNKIFYDPVKLNCLISKGDQGFNQNRFSSNIDRAVSFAFLRDDLVDTQVVPEVGDVIYWDGNYYEAHGVVQNQLFFGRDGDYSFENYREEFGSSISIVVNTHLTEANRLGIERIL